MKVPKFQVLYLYSRKELWRELELYNYDNNILKNELDNKLY